MKPSIDPIMLLLTRASKVRRSIEREQSKRRGKQCSLYVSTAMSHHTRQRGDVVVPGRQFEVRGLGA